MQPLSQRMLKRVFLCVHENFKEKCEYKIIMTRARPQELVLRPGFEPGSAAFFPCGQGREAAILDRTILPELW